MSKHFYKLFTVLTIITMSLLISWHFLEAPVLSEVSGLPSSNQTTIVATAAAPPTLESAIVKGKRVYVLYVTRAQDTVLVRCYPGYVPTITVRAMGGNSGADAQKEGTMTCKSAT